MLAPVRSICVAAAALLAASAASAQPAPPAALDAEARQATVEAAATALRGRYVFPDVGERAAAAIEAALASGAYDELAEPWAFATRLTADLQEVANDKHLRVFAPGPPPLTADLDAARPAGPPPRSEGGVTRADILPDNIGYLEVVAFPPPDVFKLSVDRAMADLADTRALIVDVRRNGGGSPVSVSHLVSYFIDSDAPVLVNTFIWRNAGTDTYRTDEFWSAPTPVSYAGKPVYVLTSGFTFSGGEEFAYDMQVMNLAELVGETTGGGANPGGTAPLAAGLAMFLPGGRAENPITATSWEGVGVIPDIAVPVEDALKVALAELGLAQDETQIDALSQARLFEPRTTPHPDSEAAVRRVIDELARGEPNYDLLSEDLAQITRQQLPNLQEMFSSLGAIESVTFREVGPQGADIYDVTLANGSGAFFVVLTPEGKAALVNWQPSRP